MSDNFSKIELDPSLPVRWTLASILGSGQAENPEGLVVLDEGAITEIFPDYVVTTTCALAASGASDSQISNVLQSLDSKVIFVTTDKHGDFPSPSNNLSIIRFGTNNTSTATQVGLLWRLSKTRGFRDYHNWYYKDIHLGLSNFYSISEGKRSELRQLYVPHPDSPDYEELMSITSPPSFLSSPTTEKKDKS
jgi:hypothetical protein